MVIPRVLLQFHPAMATVVLDDEELQRIYTWIDEVPLSRPKRNITRDFSDGGECGAVATLRTSYARCACYARPCWRRFVSKAARVC